MVIRKECLSRPTRTLCPPNTSLCSTFGVFPPTMAAAPFTAFSRTATQRADSFHNKARISNGNTPANLRRLPTVNHSHVYMLAAGRSVGRRLAYPRIQRHPIEACSSRLLAIAWNRMGMFRFAGSRLASWKFRSSASTQPHPINAESNWGLNYMISKCCGLR